MWVSPEVIPGLESLDRTLWGFRSDWHPISGVVILLVSDFHQSFVHHSKINTNRRAHHLPSSVLWRKLKSILRKHLPSIFSIWVLTNFQLSCSTVSFCLFFRRSRTTSRIQIGFVCLLSKLHKMMTSLKPIIFHGKFLMRLRNVIPLTQFWTMIKLFIIQSYYSTHWSYLESHFQSWKLNWRSFGIWRCKFVLWNQIFSEKLLSNVVQATIINSKCKGKDVLILGF